MSDMCEPPAVPIARLVNEMRVLDDIVTPERDLEEADIISR